MTLEINIGGRLIGKGHPPFVIAEAGINHNGILEKALEMVVVAKESGADAVKFQTFRAEEFVGDKEQMYTYRSQGREVTESMLAMFQRYELPREAWFEIKKECERREIIFLSTPQNRSDLDLLLEVGISAIKVGSDDFTNLHLLSSFAETGLPLLLSCGMADLAEVYQALETVGALDGYPTVLLLCTSQYPTPSRDVNLLKLKTLKASFPVVLIGFSDHTQGDLASSIAVGLGACLLEKHFTLSHDLPGPDHWFSMDPCELKIWMESIRTAHLVLGSSVVRPTQSEEKMKVLARRSVVALQDISSGEILTQLNIGLRRPGDGISSSHYSQLLGKTVRCDIQIGHQLQWSELL
jgi:N,N'-diacetyllegionaminate synthase